MTIFRKLVNSMEIKLVTHTVREVCDGYLDSAENGVVGYHGQLNIRPAFQREFVYDDNQRKAVIDTINKGFPLNVMYWCNDDNGNYELLDGQQRTISICQYVNGDFSLNDRYFHNLTVTEQNHILDYELMIYECSGTDEEKLDWFQIINIAGEKLYQQELRNAIYTGEWLTDAKRHFSKTGCPAYKIGNKLLSGKLIRQDYLQTALEWIAERDETTVNGYMALHQHDTNANELWLYFNSVITWVNAIFPKYRKEMQGITWGILYNHHKDDKLDPKTLEERVSELMKDDDVTAKKGIYEYLLTENESKLHIRAFTDSQKRTAYEKQGGICKKCGKHFEIDEMQGDHITPWSKGGHTLPENLQMLCNTCNRKKSSI